jgi:hypothetical protein
MMKSQPQEEGKEAANIFDPDGRPGALEVPRAATSTLIWEVPFSEDGVELVYAQR